MYDFEEFFLCTFEVVQFHVSQLFFVLADSSRCRKITLEGEEHGFSVFLKNAFAT